jgi:hypothetical protein
MKGFIRIKEAGRPEVLVNVNQITAIEYTLSGDGACIRLSSSGYIEVFTPSVARNLQSLIEEALKE